MIIEVQPEAPLVDAMNGAMRWHSQVSEFGFVDLVDVMPRLVPSAGVDAAIVQAARVSYGEGTKTVNDDRGLIRYLMRHTHTTPFEMVELKFHCSMPIFVARQWIRHRTANVNEVSGRYSVLPNSFYRPPIDDIRKQSKTNRQGRDEPVDVETAEEFIKWLDTSAENYAKYESFCERGIAREMARMNLPVSIFTQWYWKIDALNLLKFLALRCDSHAQKEIRVYADAMLAMISRLMPVTIEAWNDYHPMRNAVLLTRHEAEAIRKAVESHGIDVALLQDAGKTEQKEWEEKATKLGFVKAQP